MTGILDFVGFKTRRGSLLPNEPQGMPNNSACFVYLSFVKPRRFRDNAIWIYLTLLL